jgi:hypothetical protein
MPRQFETSLTLNLPCSAGLIHDIETRVTIEYSIEAGSCDWKLVSVRLPGEPGVVRETDRDFFLFKEACAAKDATQAIVSECFDHWDLREFERAA